jgi:hypothetical protein
MKSEIDISKCNSLHHVELHRKIENTLIKILDPLRQYISLNILSAHRILGSFPGAEIPLKQNPWLKHSSENK